MRQLKTLKFQIFAALSGLLGLSAIAIVHSQQVLLQQHADDVLLRLGGQLQLHQRNLAMQAMNYARNAPRDYPSYYRDLELYYRDLAAHRADLDAIIKAFASDDFPAGLTGIDADRRMLLGSATRQSAIHLAGRWRQFTDALKESLGPDTAEPRLEWAADAISREGPALQRAIEDLLDRLETEVTARTSHALLVNRLVLATALLLSLGILGWFYLKVLQPLQHAVEGFREVGKGNFSHRIPIESDNEIGWLIDEFNHLSGRLHALLRLVTRIEQGSDLDETLAFVSETMPCLVPLDWTGVLVTAPDGRMYVEAACRKGRPLKQVRPGFDTPGSVLDVCLHNGAPFHLPESRYLQGDAEAAQPFTAYLADQGIRDAILVPIGENGAVEALVVLASESPHAYQPDQLQLVSNLAGLIGVSLARTLILVESNRLAAIGQFASAIVHEVRNPLATISLAVEHLAGIGELDDKSRRRIDIASSEISRVGRLLDDVLLYAKPMRLEISPFLPGQFFLECMQLVEDGAIELEGEDNGMKVRADRHRMQQVMVNLLHNAREASPPGETIGIGYELVDGALYVDVHNAGGPIPPDRLGRLFEPFYTSRPGGTGLGLPIVRRIVEAHGGTINITSNSLRTHARVALPPMPGSRA